MTPRVFLLSPASLGGRRAAFLLSESAENELARALRSEGAALAEVFAFTSSLYFRGKRAYARAFARPPAGVEGGWIITSDRGLVPMETSVRMEALREMAAATIDPRDPRYREPLVRSARDLRLRAGSACRAVLLGSIATDKYLDPLVEAWGEALHVPEAFIGRGDMSRGGLMLRAVEERRELAYVVAAGADRSGPRPPRLEPRVRGRRREGSRAPEEG